MKDIVNIDNQLASRSKIVNLEEKLLSMANDETIIAGDNNGLGNPLTPLEHMFADGIYVRQMKMDAGKACVGKIHKRDHVWFLLEGLIAVATEFGVNYYEAPCYIKSEGGTKRVILAIEDTIFVNVHPNPSNTQDLIELEKYNVVNTYEDYEKFKNK